MYVRRLEPQRSKTSGHGAATCLQSFSCQIIGFFNAKGQSSIGSDQDDFILVPIATLQRRVTGNTDIGAILISARQGFSTDVFSDTLFGTTRILTMLLGAVAAVSLLVAASAS